MQVGQLDSVIGEFIFPIDFIILETEPIRNSRGQILMILGKPILATSNVLINSRSDLMNLTFENITVDLNIFNLDWQLSDPSD